MNGIDLKLWVVRIAVSGGWRFGLVCEIVNLAGRGNFAFFQVTFGVFSLWQP